MPATVGVGGEITQRSGCGTGGASGVAASSLQAAGPTGTKAEDVAVRLARALKEAGLDRLARLVDGQLSAWGTPRVALLPLTLSEAEELIAAIQRAQLGHPPRR
jgi:hypothetical protein